MSDESGLKQLLTIIQQRVEAIKTFTGNQEKMQALIDNQHAILAGFAALLENHTDALNAHQVIIESRGRSSLGVL
jgi:hypothetical protein